MKLKINKRKAGKVTNVETKQHNSEQPTGQKRNQRDFQKTISKQMKTETQHNKTYGMLQKQYSEGSLY